MAKGSPIVQVRLPAELVALIDADVERSVQHDNDPRSTRSAWILHALWEVFRHRKRAKLARKRQQARRENIRLANAAKVFLATSEEERE